MWFVSCSNPKCKIDNHGNKSVRVFVSEGFNFRAQMDRDTTEVCLVCLSESEDEIGLEGNKMNI